MKYNYDLVLNKATGVAAIMWLPEHKDKINPISGHCFEIHVIGDVTRISKNEFAVSLHEGYGKTHRKPVDAFLRKAIPEELQKK